MVIIMKRIFVALLCALTAISFASCSSEKSDSAKETTQATVETTQAETQPTFNSISEYLTHPDVQKQINKSKEQFSSMYDMRVYAEGDNVLVYEYKLADQIPDSALAALKSNLSEKMRSQSSSLKPLFAELVTCVKVSDPKIKVKYINNDGKDIFEYTFDASSFAEDETK